MLKVKLFLFVLDLRVGITSCKKDSLIIEAARSLRERIEITSREVVCRQ